MSTAVTGKVRFSYAHVFEKGMNPDGQPADKYSMTVLIPKSDQKTVAAVKAAIQQALEAGVAEKWKGKRPANLRNPLRDGDVEKDSPEYAGMYFLNAKSKNRPKVVNRQLQEVLDAEEVYSGCYGRVELSFYPYDFSGNRGIGVGLENVLTYNQGERLGGSRHSAEQAFGDGYEDEFMDVSGESVPFEEDF